MMKLRYWEGLRGDDPKQVWWDGFYAGVVAGILGGVGLTIVLWSWFFSGG